MKRRAGWLVLLLAGTAAAADDAALRSIDACRAKLDPRVDVGIERIQRRCPDLLPALEAAPWRNLLPHTLLARREEISAESLRALAELVRHANDSPAREAGLDRRLLDPVLADLGEEGRQGASGWERFKRWLKAKLESRKENPERGWLDEWAQRLHTSEGVARALTYAGYVLVGLLVLAVIVAELRAAGLFGGRGAESKRSPAAEWRRRLLLTDVFDAPLAERPGMLLRLLGEALTRAHRLPASDGLTSGAIVRRARLDDEADRTALASVAGTADALRYSPTRPPDDRIERAVHDARDLLAKFARGGARR